MKVENKIMAQLFIVIGAVLLAFSETEDWRFLLLVFGAALIFYGGMILGMEMGKRYNIVN